MRRSVGQKEMTGSVVWWVLVFVSLEAVGAFQLRARSWSHVNGMSMASHMLSKTHLTQTLSIPVISSARVRLFSSLQSETEKPSIQSFKSPADWFAQFSPPTVEEQRQINATLADPTGGYDSLEESKIMRELGIFPTDNFFEDTAPRIQTLFRDAANQEEVDRLTKLVRKLFVSSAHLGAAQHRLFDAAASSSLAAVTNATMLTPPQTLEEWRLRHVPLSVAASLHQFELLGSREEVAARIRNRQLSSLERASTATEGKLQVRVIDEISYLASLRVKGPRTSAAVRRHGLIALSIGLMIALATAADKDIRQKPVVLTLMGHAIFLSAMLTRGMPSAKNHLLETRSIFWSPQSFRAAATIMSAGAAISFVISRLLLGGWPKLSDIVRSRGAMILSLICNGWFTGQFEVFESPTDNGIRRKKFRESRVTSAVESELEEEERLRRRSMIRTKMWDTPDLLDVSQNGDSREVHVLSREESEKELEYQQFLDDNPNWQSPVTTTVRPEWDGGKLSHLMNEENNISPVARKIVDLAYKVGGAAWTKVKSVAPPPLVVREEPVEGPTGFRAARPEWFARSFSNDVYDVRQSTPLEIARKYGVYRRGMRKLDPLVVVQRCDGVSG